MAYQPSQHIVAVSGYVTNAQGQVLLVKTERRGWEFPGGQVEHRESLTDALRREIEEESGVIAEVGQLLVINTNLTKAIQVLVFRARYLSGELTPQIGETSDVRWVECDELEQFVTHPVNLQRVRDALTVNEGILYRAYTLNPFHIVETRTL